MNSPEQPTIPVQHTTASVAIVILNWNGRSFLQQYLPSVLATTYTNKKIIVADNASSDDSVAFLQEYFPSVEIIINPDNGGYAKGYNTALKQVSADYYVLLNSDVEVTPGWLEPVISLMEEDKNIAACQPKILDAKNRTLFEYAGAAGGFIDTLGYPFTRGRVLESIEEDRGQYNDPAECFWATGACMFVRANAFHELGGLDEYFFAHQEEIDLCWRMKRKGYRVFAQPLSVVYHVGGGTLPKGNSKKTYLNFRNNLIMLWKNLPAAEMIWKIPFRIGLDGLAAWKALFAGDGGYFIAVVKAHLHFIGWVFTGKNQSTGKKISLRKMSGVYRGFMVWQYYFRKKKTFSLMTTDHRTPTTVQAR